MDKENRQLVCKKCKGHGKIPLHGSQQSFSCSACFGSGRESQATADPHYGTFAWYEEFVHTLANAELKAHQKKREDYCGVYNIDNIFWMFDDTIEHTTLSFEDIWLAWASRHFNALKRAMDTCNHQQAGKRALDLMGWLFLLLAKYQPKNSPQ